MSHQQTQRGLVSYHLEVFVADHPWKAQKRAQRAHEPHGGDRLVVVSSAATPNTTRVAFAGMLAAAVDRARGPHAVAPAEALLLGPQPQLVVVVVEPVVGLVRVDFVVVSII